MGRFGVPFLRRKRTYIYQYLFFDYVNNVMVRILLNAKKKHGSQRGQENLTHTHVFCRSKNSRKHISQENRSPGKVRTQKLCQSGTALRPNGQMAAATPA